MRFLHRLREIISDNYDIGTEEESEINTGSMSSFETANSECPENREELVMFWKLMKMRKNNVELLMMNAKKIEKSFV